MKTSSEEKQNYYDALACALDPKLAARTLEISLSDELPTSRATYLVAKVARQSEHPEVAWQFAKAHMKQLLAKTDALAANSYAPGLFTFFSDAARIRTGAYAKSTVHRLRASMWPRPSMSWFPRELEPLVAQIRLGQVKAPKGANHARNMDTRQPGSFSATITCNASGVARLRRRKHEPARRTIP